MNGVHFQSARTVCAVLCLSLVSVASADVQIVESGWSLTQTWSVGNAWSVAYNPQDGSAYAVDRSVTGGVYRLNADGTSTMIVSADRAGGLAFDPDNGDMYIAEDYDGVIKRVAFGDTTSAVWVSGFDAGDDDIAGIIVVPSTYTGGLVAPGSGLVADRGYGSADELWLWSPDTAEGETELINDFTGLGDPFDIAANDTRIILVDGGASGQLFELVSDNVSLSLVEVITTTTLVNPEAAVFDSLTNNLFVAQAIDDDGSIVRVDLDTGDVSPVITGLDAPRWGSLDISPDGQKLYVGTNGNGMVYEFTVPEPATMSLLGLGGLVLIRRRRSS